MNALDRALELIAAGFWIFPSWAKKRHVTGWPTRATNDEATVRQWFSPGGPYAHCWPSIYCGKYGDGSQSLIAVDVDPRGMAALESGILDSLLPDTRVHRTRRKGIHGLYAVPFPGVKSGTNVLADGIDIRSKGGLVFFGEGYSLEKDMAIAPAPAALIAKCGDLAPVTAPADRAQDRVEPDQEAAMQRGEELVRGWPEVNEGDRNKALYQFICRVRETCATDAENTLMLGLQFAAERCVPAYPEDEARATIASAIKTAHNPAGSKGATADDFSAFAANDAPAQPEPGSVVLRRARSLATMNPGPALWEGVLPERAIFAIGALPGRSKSYTATGLAYALATDAGKYLGRAIPTGTAAVYVDVERLSMTELRLAVWCHADAHDPAKLPLLLTDGVRLSDPNTVKALIEASHAAQAVMLGGRRISLVLVDSLGAALPGQEMNSSAPATSVGMQLRRIRDSLNCAVGVVAHSPKSGDETVAGSLHFDAIFDTALFVRSDDGAAGSLYAKKDNGLALEEHERFTHWRRHTLAALVGDRTVRVHRLEHGDAPAAGAKVRHPWKENSTTGRVFRKHIQLSPDNRPVSAQDWKDGCLEFLSPRQVRSGFFDAKDMLRKHRAIEETAPGSDLWVRRMHSGDSAETTAGGAG